MGAHIKTFGTDRSRFPSAAALAARYQRIAARHGAKNAVIALAHALFVIAYHVICAASPTMNSTMNSAQRTSSRRIPLRAQRLVWQ